MSSCVWLLLPLLLSELLLVGALLVLSLELPASFSVSSSINNHLLWSLLICSNSSFCNGSGYIFGLVNKSIATGSCFEFVEEVADEVDDEDELLVVVVEDAELLEAVPVEASRRPCNQYWVIFGSEVTIRSR